MFTAPRISAALAACALLLLTACATPPPSTNERNFGMSVRHMIQAQTLNAGSAPSDDPVTGLDGQRGEKIIRNQRGAVADPKQMPSEVTINMGK